MNAVRVGIIGAGVAGPVLAMFLKLKGYEPVVFERKETVTDAGNGIGIAGNGLRVISKIPGLIEHIGGWEIDELSMYSVVPGDEGLLGTTGYYKRLKQRTGFGSLCIRRRHLQERLLEFAENLGIEVRWAHKLENLDQSEEGVVATFENGSQESFSFVVGCDGLYSRTRVCLFGEQPVDYTGVAHWGCMGPMPEEHRGTHTVLDIYGEDAHMIFAPLDESHAFCAVSVRQDESREAWKNIDDAALEDFKKSRFSEWPFGAGKAVKNSTRLIMYGLYDRPELETWHRDRIIIIGDAAHPSSTNYGQGANQAIEDIDILIELLEKNSRADISPSTATLNHVFTELEAVRIPRTAELAKGARKQGETRVVAGREACIARNNYYREMCKDEAKLKARFGV